MNITRLVGAEALLKDGNLAGAEQEVRQFVTDMSPNVPSIALILLAEILKQKGEFAQAAELIEIILKQHPYFYDDPQLLGVLALSHKSLGKWVEAENCYRKLATLVPENLSYLASVVECKIGNQTLSLTEFDDIWAQLKEYVTGRGLDSEWKRVHVALLARSGRVSEALEEYLPFLRISIDPNKEKKDWYNYKQILNSDSMESQSQRFGSSSTRIDEEFAYIRKMLRFSKTDSVLDVGGAGGLFAERIGKYVEKVTLTDISPELVAIAGQNLKSLENISCAVLDITNQRPEATFEKILMSGVTPVFRSQVALYAAIRNLVASLNEGGRCLISNNYDISSAETAVKNLLERARERPLSALVGKLHGFENLLWIDISALEHTIRSFGVGSLKVLNIRLTNDKRRMFDLLITK